MLGAKTGLEFQVEGRGSEAKSPEECRSRSNKAFGPSWELELLRVGERLKKKLQDPHFVATRVSESDDLELHQLQQALKVFGMDTKDLSSSAFQENRISKEHFAQMVSAHAPRASLHRSLVLQTEAKREAPRSKRISTFLDLLDLDQKKLIRKTRVFPFGPI